MAELSTKPYLIRAIHAWCSDSGYRPYIAVLVDERTIVPREYVRNGEIVLNVSDQATNRLRIGHDLVEFEARFSGVVRSVSIPIDNVSAIYAQETGHGMAFDVPKPQAVPPSGPVHSVALPQAADSPSLRPVTSSGKRTTLTAVPDLSTSTADATVTAQPVESPRKASKGPRVVAPRTGAASPAKSDAQASSPAVSVTDGGAAPSATTRARPGSRRLRAVDGDDKTKPIAEGVPPAGAPGQTGSDEKPPDEPPPSRPYLKRIK